MCTGLKAQTGNITFAYNWVKAACCALWDTDGDGELSYAEADSVTIIPSNLFGAYTQKNTLFTFDELKYFKNVTTISDSAFYPCEGMESIILPDSVKSIGKYAFKNCYELLSIDIPKGVTDLKDYTFII